MMKTLSLPGTYSSAAVSMARRTHTHKDGNPGTPGLTAIRQNIYAALRHRQEGTGRRGTAGGGGGDPCWV